MNIKFKLAQINLFVGNFNYNFQKIKNVIHEAIQDGTDILIFPELTITGYPPEDLLFRKRFINENLQVLKKITALCKNILCVIGFVDKKNNFLYNAAAIIYNKEIQYIYHKIHLPNYSVFDEKRYFNSGNEIPVIQIKDIRFGLGICEDIWVEDSMIEKQAKYGATNFIINLNASPYYIEKHKERIKLIGDLSSQFKNYILYLNMIGSQDEIVFDGHSLIFNDKGQILKIGKLFEEETINISLDFRPKQSIPNKKRIKLISIKNYKPKTLKKNTILCKPIILKQISREEEVYKALVIGTKDYLIKNGFKKAVIGLSGGIDSSLTALIAADAIGKDNILGVFMPSRFSSNESLKDAEELVKNLSIKYEIISIEPMYQSYLLSLKELFKDTSYNITEENIQARIRGNILMAISNKFGHLVLATGNKSEMSTGYSTLYGDLAGGFAVIKDIYKTMVYRLAEYRNRAAGYNLIPENIIHKAPTAELRENQKDQDTLPDYDLLDKILYNYIERNITYTEILALKKFNPEIVKKVITMVDQSEYKRRQSPPGIKISKVSFGKDRRMPITNGYLLKNKL